MPDRMSQRRHICRTWYASVLRSRGERQRPRTFGPGSGVVAVTVEQAPEDKLQQFVCGVVHEERGNSLVIGVCADLLAEPRRDFQGVEPNGRRVRCG